MVSLGNPVRSGAIAPKPSRPRERRIQRREGYRAFSACPQDGRRTKPRRAFSKLAVVEGLIKSLTVINLVLASSVPEQGRIRKAGDLSHGLNRYGTRIAEQAKVRGSRSSP